MLTIRDMTAARLIIWSSFMGETYVGKVCWCAKGQRQRRGFGERVSLQRNHHVHEVWSGHCLWDTALCGKEVCRSKAGHCISCHMHKQDFSSRTGTGSPTIALQELWVSSAVTQWERTRKCRTIFGWLFTREAKWSILAHKWIALPVSLALSSLTVPQKPYPFLCTFAHAQTQPICFSVR